MYHTIAKDMLYYSELDAIMLASEESRWSIFGYLSLGQR